MMAMVLVYMIDLEDYDGLLVPGLVAAGATHRRPIPIPWSPRVTGSKRDSGGGEVE
jgi:hypothetical protein